MTDKKKRAADDEQPKKSAAKKSSANKTVVVAGEDDHRSEGRTPVRHAQPESGLTPKRLVAIAALMFLAFFGAYNFASSKTANAQGVNTGGLAAAVGGAPAAAAGGGGCCGGGGAPVEGSATVEGDVQKLSVDTSSGSFNPNVIKLKAGIPAEINFSQSGGGCLSGVYFPDFNINEDLTTGAKTVKIPALEKGATYTFYCQMQMVSAQIVVE